MKQSLHVAAVSLILWSAAVLPANAQSGVEDGGPDLTNTRMKLGPLWLTPHVELKNLGVDTNVFNEPDEQHPKSDFTFTLTPSVDMWLRIGRSWLQTNIREDLVWYQDYAGERSANEIYGLNWRIPVNRVAFTIAPTYTSTRERPGYEIDARVHRTEWGGTAGVEVRALSKTSFGVTGSYKDVAFDDGAVFLGTNLHDELNRTETAAGFLVRHQLTPLTTLAFNATEQRDRFTYSPLRDSDSAQIVGTASFDTHALLKGSASAGYRDFRPLDAAVPGYTGFVAEGGLTYTLLESTQFQVHFKRDVTYSFDASQPYYLESGISGSIAQQVFGPIDVMVRGGTASLAYRDRAGAAVAFADRVDDVTTFGGGVGYHIGGGTTRLGFSVDQYRRSSDVASRRYDALRYGASLTYGF